MTTAPSSLGTRETRPKTLGAVALSRCSSALPAGSLDGPIDCHRAIAAGAVALALQVGVNFANRLLRPDCVSWGPTRNDADRWRLHGHRPGHAATLVRNAAVIRVRVRRGRRRGAVDRRESVVAARRSRRHRRGGHLHGAGRSRTATSGGRGDGPSSSSGSSRPSAAPTCSTPRCPGVAWVRRARGRLPACGILLANNVLRTSTPTA